MNELDDITIKQAAGGNKKAFKIIYNYYSPYVWKVVYRTVNGNTSDAQQVLQNIFITMHRTLSSFRFKAAFSTWLYRIVFNESMSYLKKENKSKQKKIPFDENRKPAETSDHYENKDMVKVILDTLSVDERFLLISREVNGFSFTDLALITGKTSGALRTMIHRIKENIRKGFCYESGRVLSETV